MSNIFGMWSLDESDVRDDAQSVCDDAGNHIADVFTLGRPGDMEANAALIAAAPELLEALKTALAYTSGMAAGIPFKKASWQEQTERFEQVIAKAEGR